MITGWPSVTRLKNARSAGSRQGSRLSRPITRLRDMAMTSERRIRLDRDGGTDAGVRIVFIEHEIVEREREEVVHGRLDSQDRERPRRSRELLARLFEVVQVEMRIAQREHELPGLEPAHLRDHAGEQ